MLKPLDTTIEKLMFLRDVVIPFVREKEKEGKADLDFVTYPCGSPSCLLGWATTFPHMGLTYENCGIGPWDLGGGYEPEMVGERLGISEDDAASLFGSVGRYGSLDDRAAAIDSIIARKISENTP